MHRCQANTRQCLVFCSVFCVSVIAESELAEVASSSFSLGGFSHPASCNQAVQESYITTHSCAEKNLTPILGHLNAGVFLGGFLGNRLKADPGSPKNDNFRDHAAAIGVFGYKEV
jgi:hypothetical protein